MATISTLPIDGEWLQDPWGRHLLRAYAGGEWTEFTRDRPPIFEAGPIIVDPVSGPPPRWTRREQLRLQMYLGGGLVVVPGGVGAWLLTTAMSGGHGGTVSPEYRCTDLVPCLGPSAGATALMGIVVLLPALIGAVVGLRAQKRLRDLWPPASAEGEVRSDDLCAVGSYVLGTLAMIPFLTTLVLGPLAFLLGSLALDHNDAQPDRYRHRGHALDGRIRGLAALVVVGVAIPIVLALRAAHYL